MLIYAIDTRITSMNNQIEMGLVDVRKAHHQPDWLSLKHDNKSVKTYDIRNDQWFKDHLVIVRETKSMC